MMRLLLLMCLCWINGGSSSTTVVSVDWGDIIAISKSTYTLQVVANPLLNPKTCPVAENAWKSLENLGADMVRYVPWFPYPKVGVAELNPPDPKKKTTSWEFADIIPQLESFMNATAMKGHTTVPNFSTQPTWMYDTSSWSYPEDPNTSDFGYPRGNQLPNTTKNVVAYYGRLLSWLVKGTFTDEYGHIISGGPAYGEKMTHWEVFNEPQGCHGLDVDGYIKQYDAVTTEISKAIAPYSLKFVGLALAGSPISWWRPFLNHSNHAEGVPLDYASFHFYANSKSRTDPTTYSNFFVEAHNLLVNTIPEFVQTRNQLSPMTKMSCDEMGVILPADNDPKSPIPPPIYWNAAGAMWAYVATNMMNMGVEVLGESQLAGSPPIPKWDIPDPQFPSVSMLNWTTGEGNARYWVLKLMLDHGPKIGDMSVKTSSTRDGVYNGLAEHEGSKGSSYYCAEVNGHNGYGNATLQCDQPGAAINDIQFAEFGTPYGSCGAYTTGQCSAKGVRSYVENECIGKSYCSILSYPTFGDPCYGVFKYFVIQATCSTGTGKGTPAAVPIPDPHPLTFFSQGFINHKDMSKNIIMVNTQIEGTEVTLPTGSTGTIWTVDEATGWGPPREAAVDGKPIVIAPWAVSIVKLD